MNSSEGAVASIGLGAAMTSVNATNLMSAMDQQAFMSSIFEPNASIAHYKNLVYKFNPKSRLLDFGDYLEIYCYKCNKRFNR